MGFGGFFAKEINPKLHIKILTASNYRGLNIILQLEQSLQNWGRFLMEKLTRLKMQGWTKWVPILH